AALHDQYRGERLRHRPEPEPGVRPGPDLVGPQWTVGAVQRDRQRRDAPVRLGALREPLIAVQWIGHRQTIGPSGAPPSTWACTWSTSCPLCGPVLKITRYPSPSPSARATSPTAASPSPASPGAAAARPATFAWGTLG